jgi:hypothetical protein
MSEDLAIILTIILLAAALYLYQQTPVATRDEPRPPIIIQPRVVEVPKKSPNFEYTYPDQETVRVVVDKNAAGPSHMVYEQVGYLTSTDSGVVIPLYGKPSYARRGRYYYYTIVNDIKVPVYNEGRDCMKEIACNEVYDGYEVVVPDHNPAVKWTVKLYDRTYF